MKKYALAAALALLPFASMAAGPNLIQNGSFEDTSTAVGTQQLANGAWSVFASLPGWTTVAGPGIEVRRNVAGTAQEGTQFVELDSHGWAAGNNNSAMQQGVATAAGHAYTLSFWYSPRTGTGIDTNDITVSWNGAALETLTGANATGNNVWTLHTYTVFGTGGTDLLRFAAGGKQDTLGGSLDNVSLMAAVPEPETYAMMLAGLGLMGTIARRRRLQG